MAKLREKAKSSLLKAAVWANPRAQIDASGYASTLEDNLIEGVSRELFEADFSAGAGRELGAKLRASHSSAALVVNSFAPWRKNPTKLFLANATGFDALRFEVPFPTGLLGTPPHLDLVAFGLDPVAVESKCLEYLTPTQPKFSLAYDTIADARRDSAWFKLIEKLRRAPLEFQFLDVAQLVKHSLGLMNSASIKDVTLLYLYWEPLNHEDFHEFQLHRQEIASLEKNLKGAKPLFRSASYAEMWEDWGKRSNEEWLHAHLARLKQRYSIVIPPGDRDEVRFWGHHVVSPIDAQNSTPQLVMRDNSNKSTIEESPTQTSTLLTNGKGMLEGTHELINTALGLEVAFDTKTAARRLSESPISLNAANLLEGLYEQIVRNWDGSKCRSTKLWQAVAKTDIAAHNTSPEKTLEKAIAKWVPGWFNQIPTASGLLIDVEEKHRNVDLGHFIEPGHLELIELKAGPNAETPVKAAFEVAGYALLYCFARAHRLPLSLATENRILEARRVDLKALAPREVYKGYSLKWLGTSLDAGFQEFSRRRFNGALEMTFSFESFADDFQWPGAQECRLHECLERRTPPAWD